MPTHCFEGTASVGGEHMCMWIVHLRDCLVVNAISPFFSPSTHDSSKVRLLHGWFHTAIPGLKEANGESRSAHKQWLQSHSTKLHSTASTLRLQRQISTHWKRWWRFQAAPWQRLEIKVYFNSTPEVAWTFLESKLWMVLNGSVELVSQWALTKPLAHLNSHWSSQAKLSNLLTLFLYLKILKKRLHNIKAKDSEKTADLGEILILS